MRRLIPLPKDIRFAEGELLLENGVAVELKTAENEEHFADLITDLFQEYWGIAPVVKLAGSKTAESFLEDQYQISIQSKKITLVSHCEKGLQLAMKTLRQLAEPCRCGVQGFWLKCCKIKDYADTEFRAVKLKIVPEESITDVEKELRFAAAMKFNYAFVEPVGIFPFKSHPEFGWRDQMKRSADFRHLLDVADECGIKLIPCFNIFHGSFSCDYFSGQHAVLNFHRDLASLFEPGGESLCFSNPETRKVISDLILELYDFFEQPEYFHLGCLNDSDFRQCRECCAMEPGDLVSEYILSFYDIFTGEERPRFIFGKNPSQEEQKKIALSLPGDILLEMKEGQTIPDGLDILMELNSSFTDLPADAGGVVFPLDYRVESMGEMADLAWNSKQFRITRKEDIIQNYHFVVWDMDLQKYTDSSPVFY